MNRTFKEFCEHPVIMKMEKVLKTFPTLSDRMSHQIVLVSWEDPLTGKTRYGTKEIYSYSSEVKEEKTWR